MARKRAQAFRTITEVSDWLDTPSHVLRFWESKFPQIKPVKRAGGRRYYRPEDLKLIGGIKVLLHDKGTTIAAVKEMIKTEGEDSVEVHSPEPVFPEKGRRKLRKAAAQAKVEADKAPQEVVVETSNDDAPDVLQLGDPAVPVPTEADASDAEPAVTRTPDPIPEPAPPVVPKLTKPGTVPLRKTAEQMAEVKHTPLHETSPRPLPTGNEQQRENQARDVISNAISRVRETPNEDRNMAKLTNLKTRTQIADNKILDIEDLYFQLQRIRNRMKRRLDSI
jgi:DNA-binding transcriptional MerR regulator